MGFSPPSRRVARVEGLLAAAAVLVLATVLVLAAGPLDALLLGVDDQADVGEGGHDGRQGAHLGPVIGRTVVGEARHAVERGGHALEVVLGIGLVQAEEEAGHFPGRVDAQPQQGQEQASLERVAVGLAGPRRAPAGRAVALSEGLGQALCMGGGQFGVEFGVEFGEGRDAQPGHASVEAVVAMMNCFSVGLKLSAF